MRQPSKEMGEQVSALPSGRQDIYGIVKQGGASWGLSGKGPTCQYRDTGSTPDSRRSTCCRATNPVRHNY